MMAMVSLVACGGDDNDTPNPPEKKTLKLTKMIIKTKSFTRKEKKELKEVIKISYGANGYVNKTTGVEGIFFENEFVYNDKNQLIKEIETIRDNNGKVKGVYNSLYSYNENGLLVSKIDENKDANIYHKTTYEYNAKNLMVKRVKHNSKSVSSYEYDADGNLIKEVNKYDTSEFTTAYTFDDKKNPSIITYPKEYRAISPSSTGQHNVLSEVGKSYKNIYTYTYNDEGYPIKQEDKYYDKGKLSEIETTEFFYE